LLRAPGFSLVTILILAVGLAGTIVMATLIQGVILRPLPVHDQDRLIVAWKQLPSSGFEHAPFGDTEIEAVAEASRLLEAVAGVGRHGVFQGSVIEDGVAHDVNQAFVTGGFFDVLGVRPLLGRALARTDDLSGAENVVVISHRLWQRHYARSPDVIGRRLSLNGERFTIVGVMPPDVDYPRGADLWRTTRSAGGVFGDAARREVDLIGRFRPDATIGQVTSELAALTRRLDATAPPAATRGLVPVVHSLQDVVVGDIGPILVAVFAAVALVLVIATANAANLLSMRNEARQTELAVRMALGAGRGRIAFQVIAESVVLALAAGAAGLLLAWWSLQLLVAIVPDGLPRVESVRIDAGVVLFTIAVALATAVLTGLAPAWSLNADLIPHLRSGGRGSPGAASRRVRRAFVVAQVALAVTILAAAGLLTRTVLRLQSIDTGLPTDRLVFVELSLPPAQHADRTRHAQFLNRLIADLQAVPFIAEATPINAAPFAGMEGWDVPQFTAEGQSAERAAANPSLNLESIFPNYFATFQVRIVRGRAFTDADREGMPSVAIISEDVAARTWPGEDPIGRRLKMGGPGSQDSWKTVVGVATSTRYRELSQARPTLYLPAEQFLMTAQRIALRTTASLEQVATASRDRVRAVEPGAHVGRVVPFGKILAEPLARPRFNALVLNLFGSVAVLLATVGLYAVMATYVRQRNRDIAVRRALGASAADVRQLVVGEALWLVGLGAAIGLAGAVGASRVVRGMLYEVEPLDPVVMLGAVLLLVAASVIAAYLPARRASRVDPLVALRYE